MKRRMIQAAAIIKLFLAYIYANLFCRNLLKEDIWLICEKPTEARDNGYHFFKYLRTNHPEVKAFYVITPDSADLCKIEPFGNIIFANTFKHFVYHICAKMSINSQPGGAGPEPHGALKHFKHLVRKDQRIIFLQHGIIKDDLSDQLSYSQTGFSFFTCSCSKEADYVALSCGYPDGIVQNVGLCRFDNLFNNKNTPKRQILVMPTFRSWLQAADPTKDARKDEVEVFQKSDYYRAYSSFLTDTTLISQLKAHGYTLVFYPHYAMQPYIHCFDHLASDIVTIADRRHYDVQQLLIDSAILVTDYSSIYFDFAYMEKPEVFFQFDEETYRSGHYKQGYFEYRRDGFGPVFTDRQDVVAYLQECMERDGVIEPEYLARINAFFDRRDNHNCERTYEAVKRLS